MCHARAPAVHGLPIAFWFGAIPSRVAVRCGARASSRSCYAVNIKRMEFYDVFVAGNLGTIKVRTGCAAWCLVPHMC
jgi:hypothetical protein